MNSAEPHSLIRPWLTGKCFDFALAVSEHLPDGEFVGVESVTKSRAFPDHVAVRHKGAYYDARGKLSLEEFLTKFRGDQPFDKSAIFVISRGVLELHAGCAGMEPPYKGNREISAARKAVQVLLESEFPRAERQGIAPSQRLR